MWPFPKIPTKIIESTDNIKEENNLIIIPQEKSFDWAHYQAISNGGIGAAYQDEFNFVPTVRVLKSLYAREPWVSFCINAIARQFMCSKHVLSLKTSSDGSEQTITQHPLLTFLSSAGKENPAFFTSNNIIDMLLTGNAYVWVSKDLKDKKRLPSERVDLKFDKGILSEYQITNPDSDAGIQGSPNLSLKPEEVLHFMMPNPYTPYVGMSILMAINLPVLIDKYGREFIVGFFLRGGHTSGIIQTDATNADQLTRFVKSIMQAIGGRRNAHADKVLPRGATWAASGAKFTEIELSKILQDNQALFRAATGTTNTVLGISESVNRATAMAEMEHFWKMTILPTQYIYCAAIKHSSIWKRFGLDDRYELKFDNSRVEWIDEFGRKLEEDIRLKSIATINERRERIGFSKIDRLGDQFEAEMTVIPSIPNPLGLSLPIETVEIKDIAGIDQNNAINEVSEISKIKAELPKLQDPTIKIESYFQREFARWEDIILANIKDQKKARKIIKKRSDNFSEGLSDILVNEMIKVYDFHINRLKKAKSWKITKDTESEKDRDAKIAELKDRGKRVLKGDALKKAKTSFEGYSESNMNRIYDGISQALEDGKNLDDVALYVRETFGEFYEGQAKTIVRTEFASAMAQATYQFGNDLATISKKMKKTWITMGDNHVREDHKDLDEKSITGESDKVPDINFVLNGSSYLRYPKDESGEPKDVINCRCDLIWDVVQWE